MSLEVFEDVGASTAGGKVTASQTKTELVKNPVRRWRLLGKAASYRQKSIPSANVSPFLKGRFPKQRYRLGRVGR